jgi:hypothetical protein
VLILSLSHKESASVRCSSSSLSMPLIVERGFLLRRGHALRTPYGPRPTWNVFTPNSVSHLLLPYRVPFRYALQTYQVLVLALIREGSVDEAGYSSIVLGRDNQLSQSGKQCSKVIHYLDVVCGFLHLTLVGVRFRLQFWATDKFAHGPSFNYLFLSFRRLPSPSYQSTTARANASEPCDLSSPYGYLFQDIRALSSTSIAAALCASSTSVIAYCASGRWSCGHLWFHPFECGEASCRDLCSRSRRSASGDKRSPSRLRPQSEAEAKRCRRKS